MGELRDRHSKQFSARVTGDFLHPGIYRDEAFRMNVCLRQTYGSQSKDRLKALLQFLRRIDVHSKTPDANGPAIAMNVKAGPIPRHIAVPVDNAMLTALVILDG